MTSRWKSGNGRAGGLLTRVGVGLILAVLTGAGTAVAEAVPPPLAMQIERFLAEKAGRTGYERKISSSLLYAMGGPDLRRDERRAGLPGSSPLMRTRVETDGRGRVHVELGGDVSDTLAAAIGAMEGRVMDLSIRHRWLRGWVPMARLTDLARRIDVTWIREYLPPEIRKTNVSEGDVAHFADQARAAFGVDGAGTKVCVVSDGIDSLAERQASGDVSASVEVLSGAGGAGDEGTAMLEILSDLAPGADLGFATGIGGEAVFAENIERLRFEVGCDVIVDDLGYFAEGVFQDDEIAVAVDTVAADGALYFSAAGNGGNLNDGQSGVWEGDFVTAGTSGSGELHAFAPGVFLNTISVDSPFLFTLQWSDPLGGSANDYDLFLVDNRGLVLAASTNIQDGSQDPFEFIDSRLFNDTGLSLVIVRNAGAEARALHLNTNRGRLAIGTAGQIFGHPGADGAIAVAAVDWREAPAGGGFDDTAAVETFSSDGPRTIFYTPEGLPLTPGNLLSGGGVVRAKPDLAAADGVSTATPGFERFFGTSAAAPHAAAIASLVLAANPGLPARDIRGLLTASAIDIEAPGTDRDSGAGIIDAFAALDAVQPVAEPALFVLGLRALARPNDQGGTRGGAGVLVADSDGNRVAGATVTGTFSGDFNEVVASVTDANGLALPRTAGPVSGSASFTFCVDTIVADGFLYDQSLNARTCDTITR